MPASTKSMIVRILICLEFILFITSTMAEYNNYFISGSDSSKRYCGRMLTDSLALICQNQYGSIIPNKRSDEMDEYAYNDQAGEDLALPSQYSSYPYLARLAPASLRPRIRRDWVTRRGVYDECCRKPCTLAELSTYCKPNH